MATHQREDVRGSGVYPATGPFPPGDAVVRSPAALAHPEERVAAPVSRDRVERLAHIAGRVLFGGYFLYNGINHFLQRDTLAGYARHKGVPLADVAVPASGALILAGGLNLLAGRNPKLGAGLIVTFLLGVSPIMHAFWTEDEAQPRMQEMVNFMKNVALVGAALMIAAHPEPWPFRLGAHGAGGLMAPQV